MSTFPLRIGTPDGLLFEGDVRACGLQKHRRRYRDSCQDTATYCTALGMGEASVVTGRRKQTDCSLHRRDAFCHEWNLPSSRNHLGVERRHRRRACTGSAENAPKR